MTATITRPLCGPCNSTDLSCEDCGFDFEDCECGFATYFICKVCGQPALCDIDYASEDAECPACGELITEENYWNYPEVAAKALCDDCYVKDSVGILDTTETGETGLTGTCSHGNLHLCELCGIFRLSTNDKWIIMEKIDLEFETPNCTCVPAKSYTCPTICKVYRSKTTDPWKRIVAKPATTTGTTSKAVSTYYGKCRHYGFPLKFPDGVTVYASSSNSKRAFKDNPDFGLYLDWIWKPSWRSEFIDWPDYDVPNNFEDAYDAIIEMYERAKNGKKVEVGCIGGHGRTGTVLACMGVIAGLEARKSVSFVREEYCKETIETDSQSWWVRWFEAKLLNKPFDEDQPQGWYGYGGGYDSDYYSSGVAKTTTTTTAPTAQTNYGASHTAPQHFAQWVSGAKECDKAETCRFWQGDFKSFDNGMQISQAALNLCTTPMNMWPKKQYDIVKKAVDKTQKGSATFRLNLDKIKELKPAYIEVDGFIVPKPSPGELEHNPAIPCECDVCRYRALGGSQFLTTKRPATSLVSENDKDSLTIKMYVDGGKIVEMPVTATFEPQPPKQQATVGTVKGEYIYTQSDGWVWDRLTANWIDEQTSPKKDKKNDKIKK